MNVIVTPDFFLLHFCLCDYNRIRIHNHLVCKQTLSHLAKRLFTSPPIVRHELGITQNPSITWKWNFTEKLIFIERFIWKQIDTYAESL